MLYFQAQNDIGGKFVITTEEWSRNAFKKD